MKLLIIALSFFTRIPIFLIKSYSLKEFYKSMILLPIIGLIIGSILYLVSYFSISIDFLPFRALILLLLYFIITGGIHYDGLSDTVDALFSNKNSNEYLKIMKDPYIGTFGSLTITLFILSFFICILYLLEKQEYLILFLFPIIGRIGAIQLGAFFAPNLSNKGLGYHFCQTIRPIYFWVYFLILLILIFLKYNKFYLISYLITIFITFLIGYNFSKKTNGISGDFLGFIIEFDQIFFLFSFIILKILLI